MTRRTRAIGTAAVALLLATPAAALAATPESGSVSGERPTFEWSGEAPAFLANNVNFFVGAETIPCEPELGCDVFTFEVKEVGKLEVTTSGDGGYVDMTVRQPDGQVFNTPGDADADSKFTRSKAPVGTYTVEVINSDFQEPLGGNGAYVGLVELNDGKVTAPAAQG